MTSEFFFKIPNKYFLFLYFFIFIILIVFLCKNLFINLLTKLYQLLKPHFKLHQKFYARLVSSFAGLVFAFLLLEISLRLLGSYHNSINIEKNYKLAENADKVVICLGDSFTEGIGSTKNNDYPSVLNQMIKAEYGDEYETLNFGQSGKNSSQIKTEFQTYLQTNTPELVIIMAGSANYWNSWGFEDQGKFLYSIRTFKLLKLLYNNALKKDKSTENNSLEIFFSEDKFRNRRTIFEQSLNETKRNDTSIYMVFNSNNQALIQKFADSIINSKNPNQVLIKDLLFYSIFADKKIVFPDSLTSILDSDLSQFYKIYNLLVNSTEINEKFDNNFYQSFYYYIKASKSQKHLKLKYLYLSIQTNPYLEDAYYDLSKLNNFVPIPPSDFEDHAVCLKDTIKLYLWKFGIRDQIEKYNPVYIIEKPDIGIKTNKINSWVEEDLEEIVLACKNKGVKLIIMNYPYKYPNPVYEPINEILEDLANTHQIKFVDNNSNFNNLKINRESYFVADGHCSDLGYKYMADEIFKTIKTNKLLTKSLGKK